MLETPTHTSLTDRSAGSYVPLDEADAPTQLLVLGAVGAAGFGLSLAGVPIVIAILVVTAPMWWTKVFRFRAVSAILGLTAAAIPAGLLLAHLSSEYHEVSQSVQRASVITLVGGVAAMIALLWARTHFPLHIVTTVYGCAALADALLNSSRSWKYELAFPTAIVVVGWLGRYSSRMPAAGALLIIGLLTVLDRGRSFFGFCSLAAALVVWQGRPHNSTRRARIVYPAVVLIALGFAIYELAVRLLTAGYLGAAAQQRTVAQIESSGSLITSGRPEWLATRALMSERPWGYGLGVVPDARDYAVAKSGFDSIGAQPGGYLTNFMLGGRFRLHSVTADLWVSYGVVGVALAVVVTASLLVALGQLLSQRACPPIVILAVIMATWHMAFGPIYSNWPDVCFALGITLLPRFGDRPADGIRDRRSGRDQRSPVLSST